MVVVVVTDCFCVGDNEVVIVLVEGVLFAAGGALFKGAPTAISQR